MRTITSLHNRLIDLAIMGDLLGAAQSAACFRYAADELALIINAKLYSRNGQLLSERIDR